MKKGIDPLFWWGLGIFGVIMACFVVVGVATAPRTPTASQPATIRERKGPDWKLYLPGWAFVVPSVGSGVGAAAGAVATKRRRLQQGQTATADGWPSEVEQSIKKVTSYTHDRKVAERLMMQCSKANPDKSIHWVVEKVVQDIIRDRR